MSNNIVMAFSPQNIVGCLLKKGLQRGDHGHPRTPLATPLHWHQSGYQEKVAIRHNLRSNDGNYIKIALQEVKIY